MHRRQPVPRLCPRLALPCSAALLLALLAGCGEGAPEAAFGARGSAIHGGQIDSVDRGVVVVYDTTRNLLCTGSLVAPNLVLTARHCVATVSGSSSLPAGAVACGLSSFLPPVTAANLTVTPAGDISGPAPPSPRRSGQQIFVPDAGSDLCGFDVALIALDGPFDPADAAPLVPRVDRALVAGEAYRAIGYGATDGAGDGAGVRRFLSGLSVDCVGPACGVLVKEGEWSGPTGVCPGDSGGPALDDAGRVVGVAVRGQSGSSGCDGPIYTGVFAWASWISSITRQVASAAGTPPPPWATGAPTGAPAAGGAGGDVSGGMTAGQGGGPGEGPGPGQAGDGGQAGAGAEGGGQAGEAARGGGSGSAAPGEGCDRPGASCAAGEVCVLDGAARYCTTYCAAGQPGSCASASLPRCAASPDGRGVCLRGGPASPAPSAGVAGASGSGCALAALGAGEGARRGGAGLLGSSLAIAGALRRRRARRP